MSDGPDRPRKARPVAPPTDAPTSDEQTPDTGAVDRRPPPEQRRAPGRGGVSSRDLSEDGKAAPRTGAGRGAPSGGADRRVPSARGPVGTNRAGGRGRSGADRGGRGGSGGRPAERGGRDDRGAKGGDRGRRDERGGGVERQSRRSAPSTPGGARGKPLGADQARQRPDAPRRAPSNREAVPPRPDLPMGDRPNLPKPVRKDLERTLGPGRRLDEVSLALSVGSQAIDDGALDVALEMLAWAKHQAPRVAAIREAYGVARYLTEDYGSAVTELQAYVRISGRTDQNHVLADALRAQGRDLDRVSEVARQLIDDERAPADRRAEAVIVLAAALAEGDRLEEGRVLLAEHLAVRRDRDAAHHRRVRSLAADLAVQAGDRELAIRHLEALTSPGPDEDYDAEARLDALRDG